jgi:hypothetical protein
VFHSDTFALIDAAGKVGESDESTGYGSQANHCGARGHILRGVGVTAATGCHADS